VETKTSNRAKEDQKEKETAIAAVQQEIHHHWLLIGG
jgi:hypothetical protein